MVFSIPDDTPALIGRQYRSAPMVLFGKKYRQISDAASGILKAGTPARVCSNSTGGEPPEITGGTFGATVEQPGNRFSDYRRTAKAASRFWRGSTIGAA
jgi:hypothetical protein